MDFAANDVIRNCMAALRSLAQPDDCRLSRGCHWHAADARTGERTLVGRRDGPFYADGLDQSLHCDWGGGLVSWNLSLSAPGRTLSQRLPFNNCRSTVCRIPPLR